MEYPPSTQSMNSNGTGNSISQTVQLQELFHFRSPFVVSLNTPEDDNGWPRYNDLVSERWSSKYSFWFYSSGKCVEYDGSYLRGKRRLLLRFHFFECTDGSLPHETVLPSWGGESSR